MHITPYCQQSGEIILGYCIWHVQIHSFILIVNEEFYEALSWVPLTLKTDAWGCVTNHSAFQWGLLEAKIQVLCQGICLTHLMCLQCRFALVFFDSVFFSTLNLCWWDICSPDPSTMLQKMLYFDVISGYFGQRAVEQLFELTDTDQETWCPSKPKTRAAVTEVSPYCSACSALAFKECFVFLQEVSVQSWG